MTNPFFVLVLFNVMLNPIFAIVLPHWCIIFLRRRIRAARERRPLLHRYGPQLMEPRRMIYRQTADGDALLASHGPIVQPRRGREDLWRKPQVTSAAIVPAI
jgi:hypothetical protein